MRTPYNILKKSPSLLVNIKRLDDIIGEILIYPTLFKFKFQYIIPPKLESLKLFYINGKEGILFINYKLSLYSGNE